jgi:phosphate starvation-inducible protein PhoH
MDHSLSRVQRKQQKNARKVAQRGNRSQAEKQETVNKLRLKTIEPKTVNQDRVFNSYYDDFVTVVHGCPGTGKSFISLYLALLDIEEKDTEYERVTVIRSSVSGRDMGFQPGNAKEKMKEYEAPYIKIVNDLYGRGDAYQVQKNKGILEFTSTAFLRGQTFTNEIVIVDECQNMSYQELKTIVTRFGEGCKLVLMGDVDQDDLSSERFSEYSGFRKMLDILKTMDKVGFVEMGIDDIVRHGFVKDFIIAEKNSKSIPLN